MKQPPRPYTLIKDDLPHDTIAALEAILEQARRRQAIGIVFGVMLKERHFYVNTAGEAHRNPGFSLIMTRMLEAELVPRIRSGT